jgi:dTDP-glucose pyrophosphorylase
MGNVPKDGDKPKGYRNALTVLKRFELVIIDNNNYTLNIDRLNKFSNFSEAIWISANSESILLEVVKFIELNNDISGKDIGNGLAAKYDLSWTDASRIRNGGSIRQWAYWLHEGKAISEIPKCPGRT